MPKRAGRKSKAQTPAPPSERIVGSKKNPKGSAASEKSASKIKLNEKTLTALKNKLKEFKEEHPNKSNITLNDLKAVYRRGAGAYSKSHRPTITGGVPNSRNAWSMARVNKFLLKAGGTKVKAAYVQDDDLLKMEEGGDVKTLSIQKRDIGHGKHYIKIQYGSNTIMLTNHDLYIPNEIINRINAPKEKIYQFSTVYVSPSDRGLGIASKLLKATIDYAKEKEIFLVSLIHSQSNSTLNDSELINWLSRNGFSILYTQNKALTYAYFDGSNPDVRFAKGGSTLLAPNGKKSLLTEEQWHLVRTQEFKAWFGDWENDPKNASKVVDENGEPKVVYHGSDNNFSVFDFKTNKGVYSSYSSFTNNKKLAESYGSNIYNVFLKIHNPYIIDGKGDYIWNVVKGKNSPDLFFDELPLNYDGIIFKSVIDFNGKLGTKFVLDISDIYMVRKPSQIKLADGSNTTFDSSNPDIRFENGGSTLLAPNGEPSKLTPEQYKLVRTPEFKAWFGDWENDPQNSSRVIDDETFEPLVVYHGTQNEFNEFDISKSGTQTDSGYFGKGFYFYKSEIRSKRYGNVKGYFLNIRKLFIYGNHFTHEPYPLSFAEYLKLDHLLYEKDSNGNVNYSSKPFPNKQFSEAVTNKIKKEGWQGIEVGTFDGHQFVAFEPNQIKLADGSNTTFDGNSPDIRYAEGGFNDEVIICSNCLWSWKASESTPEEKYICHKCGHDNKPTMDKITMDVPLFIRLLEFAREDAKDDMELHTLTENALKMGDKTLTMEDYNEIVFSKITSPKITKSTNSLVEFPTIEQEFADGGVVVGKRHSESDEFGTGEKFLVESTGQIVELEGGEGVLCKESMQSWHYYKFDGKEMTGRQIASYLNHKYGGVEFAKGGEVDEKSVCGCRSMYYHGGELPSATLDSLKGGEAVVTVKTMESKDKFQFQGRYMTPRKILSHINQESGGKKFEDGGIIDLTEHHLKNATNMVKMINFTEKIFYF